jgi:DNA polymerase-4/DNA polymerase V
MNGNTPVSIAGFPRAILHLDADAFFAAVEEALDPSLRGKPVVTGKERGIIACANYAARRMNIRRGVTLHAAKRLCPDLVILPSDYETYGIYSRRMFNIIRLYTPDVEEYSIDEAFADITGLRRVFRCSYEDIALQIQEQIRRDLAITVSVGLSLSKSLAKLCSKFRKPAGFTALPGRHIHLLLQRTALEKVWGFGPNTVELLSKYGLKTAYDYVMRPERWASAVLHKPGSDMWNELRGESVWKVDPIEKPPKFTVIRSKTFTPPSQDRAYVYARLVRNVESAFARIRRHRMRAGMLGVVLRRQDFRHDGMEARLNRPTNATLESLPVIRAMFEKVFRPGVPYRATLIALGNLENDNQEQMEFFQDRISIENFRKASEAVDQVNRRYGSHALGSGSALDIASRPVGEREQAPPRRGLVMEGEDASHRLAIPRWSVVV